MTSKGFHKGGTTSDADVFTHISQSEHCQRTFPACVFLINIKQVLWLQTASCERGFSLRTKIKTSQRASMQNTLLDILMMVCSNGPPMTPENVEPIKQIVSRAVQRFTHHRNRCPQRSSTAQRRKRTQGSSDVLAELRGLEYALFNDSTDEGFSQEKRESDDDEGQQVMFGDAEHVDLQEQEEEDNRNAEAAYKAVPPYAPDQNTTVLAAPDRLTNTTLKGKLIAHKFVNGWAVGKVLIQERGKQNSGQFSVRYKDLGGLVYYHDLKCQEYGCEGDWVLVTVGTRTRKDK